MVCVRSKKMDVMVSGIVVILILVSINTQPYFQTEPVPLDGNKLILSVDRDLMVMKYLNGEGGCTEELNLDLDYLELNSTTIFFRWENIGSEVMICGYDVDVLVTSDQSWLANFTILINNHKILEEITVMRPSQNRDDSTLVITMSEYRTMRVVDPALTIIVILQLSTI